jgi:hypothetical protein
MLLFTIEVVLLPACLLSLIILHKYRLLTPNTFGIITVAYLSIIASTASDLFPTMSAGWIIGLVLAFLCWFPGFPIARWIYKRIFTEK